MARRKKRQFNWKNEGVIVALFLFFVGLYYSGLLGDVDLEPTDTDAPPATRPVPIATGTDWYEVYFTQPGPDSTWPEERLVQAVDDAEERVWVASFDFELEPLTVALINAHERGVDVRVLIDTDNAGLPVIEELLENDVEVQDDLDRSAFMHNKFIVVDEGESWFGSMNLTDNDVTRNNNNFVRFISDEMNQNFATEFDEMWAGDFGARSEPNTPYPALDFGGSTLSFYFSPEDKPREPIIAAVAAAQSEIRFMAFSYTDEEISGAMLSAAEQGADVAGVIETFQAEGTGGQWATLNEYGVEVRRDGNGGVMHHKVIIIDRETVIFGSYNFTHSAYQQNDETVVIVRDADLAALFLEEWERVWAQAE